MTMAEGDLAVAEIRFVQGQYLPPQPAPMRMTGAIGWVRANLLSTPANIVLTVLVLALVVWIVYGIVDFLIVDAVWTGADRTACLASTVHREVGACWPFVWDRLSYFIYGSYPIPERWRVDVFFALLAVGVAWMLWLQAPRRDLGALYFFVVLPIVSFILLHGFAAIGLPLVDTVLWGGVLVTIVLATVGIVVSLPIGIVLALGRRSRDRRLRSAASGGGRRRACRRCRLSPGEASGRAAAGGGCGRVGGIGRPVRPACAARRPARSAGLGRPRRPVRAVAGPVDAAPARPGVPAGSPTRGSAGCAR